MSFICCAIACTAVSPSTSVSKFAAVRCYACVHIMVFLQLKKTYSISFPKMAVHILRGKANMSNFSRQRWRYIPYTSSFIKQITAAIGCQTSCACNVSYKRVAVTPVGSSTTSGCVMHDASNDKFFTFLSQQYGALVQHPATHSNRSGWYPSLQSILSTYGVWWCHLPRHWMVVCSWKGKSRSLASLQDSQIKARPVHRAHERQCSWQSFCKDLSSGSREPCLTWNSSSIE